MAEANDGREVVDMFRQHVPDVTLMDLRMPHLDGVEAIAVIRSEFPQARIVVLTTFDNDEDIYRGLAAGAMAYLLKGTATEELLDTIRSVHVGQTRIPEEVAAKLATRMNAPELTVRELEVLRLVAGGRSNKEIGTILHISDGTVRSHVNNIFSKLRVSDRTQAATLAIKRGLVRLE